VHPTRRWLILIGLVVISALGALIAAPGARAFESRGGDTVVIGADEVVEDDLYVSAGTFTLEGTVQGDLVAVGGTLNINGAVEGDLIAAGQNLIVRGTVEDDARVTGYAITLEGEVGDDVVAAGFSLASTGSGAIGGDLMMIGYQTLLDGSVGGDASVAGGAVKIGGTIQGDAKIDVGGSEQGASLPPFYDFMPNTPSVPTVPGGLTLAEGAAIEGDLTYTANTRAGVPSGAVAGEVDFNEYEPETRRARRQQPSPAMRALRWLLDQARRLATLLLVGVLMMGLTPRWTRLLAKQIEEKPLPSLGWGLVSVGAFGALMVALVMATVLLTLLFGLVTLGGLGRRFAVLGGLAATATGFSFSLLWRYVTAIAVGLLVGQLVFRLFQSPAAEHRWWPMVVGVVLFVAVTAVPVLGWLVRLIAVLLGLGAVWLWGMGKARRQPTAPAPAEA
jgi:cytoskeletal protein CcmA (bactofilin family)